MPKTPFFGNRPTIGKTVLSQSQRAGRVYALLCCHNSTEKSQIIRPKNRVFRFLAEALENGLLHVLLKGHLILWTHFKVISNLILYGFFDLPFSSKLSSRRMVKTSVQKGGEREPTRSPSFVSGRRRALRRGDKNNRRRRSAGRKWHFLIKFAIILVILALFCKCALCFVCNLSKYINQVSQVQFSLTFSFNEQSKWLPCRGKTSRALMAFFEP